MSTTQNILQIQPYLQFEGRCEEAIQFYQRALGAEVTMKMHFKDCPEKGMISPGSENKVMHASLKIGDNIVLASDGRCTGKANFQGFTLAMTVASEAAADKCFNALADGGKVQMPLEKTFFSPRFGMVEDKFGVGWMVLTRAA